MTCLVADEVNVLAVSSTERFFQIGEVAKRSNLSKHRIQRCIDSGWIAHPSRNSENGHRQFSSDMVKKLILFKELLDLPLKLEHDEICGSLINCISYAQLERARRKGREHLQELVTAHLDTIRPHSS